MCLGTVAKLKKKFNQGLKRGDSLDWFGRRWESCIHIQKGGFCIVDMAEGMLARWGRCPHCLGEYLNSRELSRELDR
jgi:hypothetical protein